MQRILPRAQLPKCRARFARLILKWAAKPPGRFGEKIAREIKKSSSHFPIQPDVKRL
jgi:hypothetical protein